MLGDRLQVWEINTNPNFLSGGDGKVISSTDPADDEHKAFLSGYAEQIDAAFAEIDVQDAPYEPGPPQSSY